METKKKTEMKNRDEILCSAQFHPVSVLSFHLSPSYRDETPLFSLSFVPFHLHLSPS